MKATLNPKITATDNKDKVKDKQFEEIFRTIQEFIQTKLLNYPQIESIIIYGSYATKSFTEESDIDLCILFKERTAEMLENEIHLHFLDLGQSLDKLIECVYIYPEKLNNWDSTFIENILAEGILLFGSQNYFKVFQSRLNLEPYQVISFNLKALDGNSKMKLNRIFYGYSTSKNYSVLIYRYKKNGLIHELKGLKLGRGAIIIPEKHFTLIKEKLDLFNVKFSSFRVWREKS